MMNGRRSFVLALAAVLLCAPVLVSPSHAGLIMVSGSDGDVFHGHIPYALDTRNFLDQGSPLPLLVLGNPGAVAAYSAAVGGVGIVTTNSLVAINLNNFSGLYLLSNSSSGTGCCDADDPLIVGFQAAINARIASGGSFGIQDYTGEATFDPILGTVGGANAQVFGFLGGGGGTINYDNEQVTPLGLANGFNNYAPLGAWGHQGFNMGFFSGLGFQSLIDAPSYPGSAAGPASALMAIIVPVPEPGILALLGLGAVGIGRRLIRGRRADV